MTNTVDCVEYTYNTAGIRVQAYSFQQPQNGGTKSYEETTTYLVDTYNHTGYAQVLEEWTGGTLTMTYTIGDDIIAQKDSSGVRFLLYDGHGSVRQHADSNGAVITYQADHDDDPQTPAVDYNAFDYDSYGQAVTPLPSGNGLYYTGEMRDSATAMYYLRARYYNPSNGRFNRVDPYSGNMQDPQSLHKYLYCHANPVNRLDPSGLFGSIADVAISIGIISLVSGVISAVIAKATGGNAMKTFILTTMTTAIGLTLSIFLSGPVGFALGALISNVIWEWYVEGFREPELSAMRIFVAVMTAFVFSYFVGLKFPALSAEVSELSVIIETAGLRQIAGAFANEFAKVIVKGIFFGIMGRLIGLLQQVIEVVYRDMGNLGNERKRYLEQQIRGL